MRHVFSFVLLASACACEHRDYLGSCPEGWVAVAGGKCRAPLSYAGPCAPVAIMADSSEDDKLRFEAKCQVQWPCAEQCIRDYKITCPLGWVDMGSGMCEAPLTYGSHCLKRVRMVSEGFKRSFAAECGVEWPCAQEECQQDYGHQCPDGWAFDGICKAPRSYAGPCAPFANLAGFSNTEKAQYAALCGAQFPCQVAPKRHADCELTRSPCPKGWQLQGTDTEMCFGIGYTGPCRPLISLDKLATIGKDTYMDMCGVEWECNARDSGSSSSHATQAPSESEMIAPSGPLLADGSIVDVNL